MLLEFSEGGDLENDSVSPSNSASDTPPSASNSEQPTPELDVQPMPTPTPDKPEAKLSEPQPVPTPKPYSTSPSQPKPPMPQKDLLQLLMKQIIAELQKNLNRIKKRKKGQASDEDEDATHEMSSAGPGQDLKLDQELVDSLRKMANDYLKPNGPVAQFLGNDLTNQLKVLADNCLDRMQNQLDRESGREQHFHAEPAEKEEPTHPEPANETPQENDRGEPLEDGMTEAEIVDAGRDLGGMLKNDEFHKVVDMVSPTESAQLDNLGDAADGLKSSSLLELKLGS